MNNNTKTKTAPKGAVCLKKMMVERTGIEPVTPTMSTWCSPAELTLQTYSLTNRPAYPCQGHSGMIKRLKRRDFYLHEIIY